jgi:hypothetical protein
VDRSANQAELGRTLEEAVPEFGTDLPRAEYFSIPPTWIIHALVACVLLGFFGTSAAPSAAASIPPAARSSMHGRIAYESRRGIWVMRADGTHRRRVTRPRRGVDFDPDFAPDGKRIVFRSERGRQPPDPYGVGYARSSSSGSTGRGCVRSIRRAAGSSRPGRRAGPRSPSAARPRAIRGSTTSR